MRESQWASVDWSLSDSDIARSLGCRPSTVHYARKIHGQGRLTREERRERRARPEFVARVESRRRWIRYREIWAAVLESERVKRLPIRERIAATPRVRGVGAAAAKAGFADRGRNSALPGDG